VWFGFVGCALLVYFWPLRKVRISLAGAIIAVAVLFLVGGAKSRWWGEESWKGTDQEISQLQPGKTETYWSPYQKLTLIPLLKNEEVVRYVLKTNDSWFQEIVDLSPEAVSRNPELYREAPLEFHKYNLPYRFYKKPENVLIAGAGLGNDVAAALRNGAGRITAVEIDPVIYDQGKRKHFERPYDSDRVRLRVDDARSFVQNAKEKYDLVVFSILDSHTTSSHYTNIRLDNYVYTLESLQATRRLLKPDGLLVMSFSSERPWFAGRLKELFTKAFGKEPLTVLGWPYFFVTGPGDRVERALAADPDLKAYIETQRTLDIEEATLTTDDWPYLYQQYRGIPVVIWLISLGLGGISWLTFRKLDRDVRGIQWHFFFLGAAFMLLEVQAISKMALLFGTTWLVNSFVITAVLLFILLSNLAVSLGTFPPGLAYAGLFGFLALGYLVPANSLFVESFLLRAVLSTGLYCAPVFFAGIVFISSFRDAGFRAEAFGSNLLGALVGGLLESLSFLTGIKALVIVAGALYFASYATMRRGEQTDRAAVARARA
jgi:spermidine synthase